MRQMTPEEMEKKKENPNILLKIGGESFYCECGCNVFHHPGTDADRFQCNACDSIFNTSTSVTPEPTKNQHIRHALIEFLRTEPGYADEVNAANDELVGMETLITELERQNFELNRFAQAIVMENTTLREALKRINGGTH